MFHKFWSEFFNDLKKISFEIVSENVDESQDVQNVLNEVNVNDVVVGRPGEPAQEETPIGNWKYGNRVYNIILEVHTNQNRQRLYDLVKEIRRICHARMHSLTSFQRIQFGTFSEATQEQVNIWTGTVTIILENNAILLETT